MRRALLLSVVAAALIVAAAGAAKAPRVTLPRDHYGHDAGIEWWYVTGVLTGSDGKRYSVFYTLFKRGAFVLPASQVVDLASGTIVGHTESVGPVAVGATALDVRLPDARLGYADGRWTFGATGTTYALSLAAVPRKPYAMHGRDGYIAQSSAGTSGYYSNTRMSATGTLKRAGRTVRLTGQAWLDHQWGNFADDPAALNWDWFSCRLADRTELMLYRFRSVDGKPLDRYRHGTLVRADGTTVSIPAFEVTAGARTYDAAGRRWPLDWHLSAPAVGVDLRLVSPIADQLVRGTLLPTFYEGVADATGSTAGTCFVEQSYAG